MKRIILISAALCCVLISCKKDVEVPAETVQPASMPVETAVTTECYQGVLKQDTIKLAVDFKGNEVPSGKLTYNFFEKDKSDGTISGVMKGDTLFASYIFVSEGQTSEREVVFLKKGNLFIEGYGDVNDDGKGKVTFKDKKKLFFDSKTVLMKTDCK